MTKNKKIKINIKRLSLICITLLIGVAVSVSIQSSTHILDGAVKAEEPFSGSLSFSVLGDVHGDGVKLQEAIRDLRRIRPGLDALVLNGDTVDEGLKSEYDTIKKTLRNYKAILPKVIVKNIGNHEFFDYKKDYNTAEDVDIFIKRYLEFSGEKKVYHDTWIKGYHFISLGSENGNTKDFDSVRAYISPEQLQWFKETMAEKYVKDRPIFVFLHQHLSSNSRGWVGTDQSEDIKKILSAYPEVILFTSHTHADLEVDNVKLNQPFTMVHTGAVHYSLVSDGKGGRRMGDGLQGIYVEVYGNKTIIKGRDFKNKAWIFTQEIK